MPGLGTSELLIVLVIVLLVFGSARLPKLARSIGAAKSEFEQGQQAGAPPESQDPPAA